MIREKVYVAGKITGDPDYKEKFEYAEKVLREQGYTVINPASLPGGMRPGDYMRICIAMIESADIVAFLPDWIDSKGAGLEKAFSDYIGRPTMFLANMRFYKPPKGKKAVSEA